MKAIENISTLENSAHILSVTLRENNFTKDGSYYATVSRNTASFKNILSEIAEDNKGVDPYMLQFAAILLQKKMLKMLEQGKAVNVLDLGTLYIAMRCKAKGKSEVPEKGNFYVKFAPTELANKAIASLSVDKVVYADGSPEIISVTDLSNNEPHSVTSGKPCRVTGGRLKVGGENGGIWFMPVDEDGKRTDDESKWVQVERSALFRNKPSELNFFAPKTLTSGRYRMLLRTSYLGKNRNRKALVEASSGILTVA